MIPKQGALYRCFSIAEGKEGVEIAYKKVRANSFEYNLHQKVDGSTQDIQSGDMTTLHGIGKRV